MRRSTLVLWAWARRDAPDAQAGASGAGHCRRTAARPGPVALDELPVHQAPERLDVVRTGVAVIDVIGVLPDVTGQQRRLPGLQRRIGIRGAEHFQRSALAECEPRPSRSKTAFRGLRELFLEFAERPERLGNGATDFAGRLAAAAGREAVPVEIVIPDLRGVVEERIGRAFHDLLQRRLLEAGALGELVH